MGDTLDKSWRHYRRVLVPALLVALGGGLRLAGLGADSLRTDELYILDRSGGTLGELVARAGETVMGAPAEFFLRHALLQWSHDEFVLRLPDALFGILSVLILYRLASRLFDPATGIVAAVLLAVSGLHLYHSQDARYYALFCLLSLASTLLLLRAQEASRPRAWAAYAATMTLGFYTAYFMAFVALVHALVVLGPLLLPRSWRRPAPEVAGFVLAGAATAAAFAPWLFVYSPVPNVPYPATSLATAARTITTEFSGGQGWVEVAAVGLFAAGFLAALRWHRSSALLCLMMVALPFPAILWADNRFHYFFAARQMIFALPFFLAVVAYAVVGVSKRSAALVGLLPCQTGALLAVALLYLWASAGSAPQSGSREWLQEDWRGVARYLQDHLQPGDVLVMSHLPFGPPEGDNVGWYLRTLGPDPAPYRMVDAAAIGPDQLKQMVRDGRLWFVVSSSPYWSRRPYLYKEIQRSLAMQAGFHGGFNYGEISIYRSRH